jgi:curved DNA-binding protein CbpA
MVPDYYARLGVDPGAERAEIEAALKRLQPAWSMGTRNPKTRHSNQLYLDEIPALRKALLGDPTARAAYDAELAVAQIAERDAKLDELQNKVRLRAAKGGLGPADRTILVEEAARLGLNEDDVVRVTRTVPTLVEPVSSDGDTALDDDPPADVLDPSTRRQIRMALDHLGCRDLYDALGVSREAPKSYIEARADEERQRWMKKAQVTAEKTAWLEIITHGQSHLGSAKARARYDRTLALEAEESFEGLAAFALKGLNRLDAGTRQALIEAAAAVGIASERADQLVGRFCRRSGVSLEQGPVAPVAAQAG